MDSAVAASVNPRAKTAHGFTVVPVATPPLGAPRTAGGRATCAFEAAAGGTAAEGLGVGPGPAAAGTVESGAGVSGGGAAMRAFILRRSAYVLGSTTAGAGSGAAGAAGAAEPASVVAAAASAAARCFASSASSESEGCGRVGGGDAPPEPKCTRCSD